jgi:uncharacterized protein YecT (DUF1311 family)
MSMARYFWIFAIYLLFAPAFAAAQITAEDRTAITQCLAQDKSGETCIGIVFHSCQSRASDPEADKACAGRELAVWNELLQASLKIVNASSPPAVRTAVAEEQSNWLKSRESLCPIFNNLDPGMSIGGANYCRLQETSRRALILQCISVSQDKKGQGEACIAVVAGPCKLAKSEGPKACAARELADSKKSLQATLKDLKVLLDLSEEQSNWLKSREGLCSLFDIIDPGTYRVGSDDCRLVETRGHDLILENLSEALHEH